MRILPCIFGAALAATCMLAPGAARADTDTQGWGGLTVTAKAGPHWRVSNETILRTGNTRGFYELEDNFMVGYKLDKTFTVWLGYTHDPNYLHGDFAVMERRFRQQVSFDNFAHLGPVRFNGRMRLEQRWRDNMPGTGWRLRPFIKASLPVAKDSKVMIVASHESFIDLNKTIFQTVNGEERMRNFIGVNAPITKTLSVEAGYLNQHGIRPGKLDSSDHVASVALTLAL
ncbi:DUF2490 domain-containing protein [Novosphingobium sp. SG720]|uniref:DUF2490 domain-containing protein n=1 Tax=Novosphingobium sp. SG720 TaxID=2586998 RepID=UPI00144545CF|nr:DUF2490 domain-containing protein [Novosphingobium sp. SG720]